LLVKTEKEEKEICEMRRKYDWDIKYKRKRDGGTVAVFYSGGGGDDQGTVSRYK
jgi:hypothetical protein